MRAKQVVAAARRVGTRWHVRSWAGREQRRARAENVRTLRREAAAAGLKVYPRP